MGWIERAQEELARNAALVSRIAAKGGNVGPTEPVEMGGDATVHEQAVVNGKQTSVMLGGVEVDLGGEVRVVTAEDGSIRAIQRGSGAPIEVVDMNRIAPSLKKEVAAALRRGRARRRRDLGVK